MPSASILLTPGNDPFDTSDTLPAALSQATALFAQELDSLKFTLADTHNPAQTDLNVLITHKVSEQDYALFSEDQGSHSDWVVVSDGSPSQWLDKMMAEGVAFHFRTPLDHSYIKEVLQELASEYRLRHSKPSNLAPHTSNLDQYGLLLGSSNAMRKLYRLIRRVSRTDANVLLVGESGCGKELAARTIHQQSPRVHAPFIAINCAALSQELVESELFGHEKGAFTGASQQHIGFFEQGGNGTLFLDEITEMPLELQSKLLRVLETGEFRRVGSEVTRHTRVRVVAATNRIPADAIDNGHLREDLYFRLAHFPIQLPPLRERGDDVIELAHHFLATRNEETGTSKFFSDAVINIIKSHQWPGNVRELRHRVERAHILSLGAITPEDFSNEALESEASDNATLAAGMSIREAERQLIMNTLTACQQNKTNAAQMLGISVKTLYNKLEQYEQAE